MRRLLPRTLFAQTLAVLLAGIALALAAGAWIYSSAREEAVRAVGAMAAAERIINVSRLVGDAPADWRRRLADGASDPLFRVTLASSRPTIKPAGEASDASILIADYIRQSLPSRTVVVAVAAAAGERSLDLADPRESGPGFGPRPGRGWGRANHDGMGPGAMGHDGPMRGYMRAPPARAAMSWRGLDAAVEIADGQWLRFTTSLPDTGPTMSPRLLIALAVMAAIIALLTAWAVRRMTTPMAVLATAASRLGRDVDAPALAVTGTLEMRRAALAFNDMQARLRRLVENRTLMLASISHDLRTELTLLRLRTEALAPGEERERMLKSLADMEAMLTATLSFARDEAKSEERRRLDVGALLTSIVDDMADAGLPVSAASIASGAVASVKQTALRRAVTNLIDNAVKYGVRATVSLSASPRDLTIAVDDEGPGIPEDQLAPVLQPFYRLEGSRNRDTGGMGLGLAIAASIAEAHGGSLSLSNRARGGLRASIVLPT